MGVRIEDDYFATERGVEWISRAPARGGRGRSRDEALTARGGQGCMSARRIAAALGVGRRIGRDVRRHPLLQLHVRRELEHRPPPPHLQHERFPGRAVAVAHAAEESAARSSRTHPPRRAGPRRARRPPPPPSRGPPRAISTAPALSCLELYAEQRRADRVGGEAQPGQRQDRAPRGTARAPRCTSR